MVIKKYLFLFSLLLGLGISTKINAYTMPELKNLFKDVDLNSTQEIMNRMMVIKFFETYPYANIEETAKKIQGLLNKEKNDNKDPKD